MKGLAITERSILSSASPFHVSDSESNAWEHNDSRRLTLFSHHPPIDLNISWDYHDVLHQKVIQAILYNLLSRMLTSKSQLYSTTPSTAAALSLANPPDDPSHLYIHPQPAMHLLLIAARNSIRQLLSLVWEVFLRLQHQ